MTTGEKNNRIYDRVDAIYRTESRRVFATLIRLLGDFDLAEEAVQNAFAAAGEQWPHEGLPANPCAWLGSTGRFKAIDALRRQARFDASIKESMNQLGIAQYPTAEEQQELEDDRLRLIFTCCHPALPPDAQVALTLREVCGLTTEEIARAFLTSASTIVRAKSNIREAHIPYEVPARADIPSCRDHSLWNRDDHISEGAALVRRALSSRRFGPYTLQAAIAAIHAEAKSSAATDWDEIVGLYDLLIRVDPSPVVELNGAVESLRASRPRTMSRGRSSRVRISMIRISTRGPCPPIAGRRVPA